MERLTEKITNKRTGEVLAYRVKFQKDVEAVQKLGRLEDLEEQGKLLKLPCTVGDTVYAAHSWGIETGVVGSIEIISDKIFINNIRGQMIGEAKEVFLIKEEAEAALKY